MRMELIILHRIKNKNRHIREKDSTAKSREALFYVRVLRVRGSWSVTDGCSGLAGRP